MKYARYVITVVSLLFLLSPSGSGQEVKQETKAGTTAQEVKPESKLESASSDTKQEAKPEAKLDTHGDSAVKEKRVVATMDFDGVQRVEVIGAEYFFDPN